eukprot:jgi/Hompol1/3715/HPOL_006698-RA
MPRSNRVRLIAQPSALDYDTPADPDRATCALRLPTRVCVPGQQFTVQFMVPYVPSGRALAWVHASIDQCVTYRAVTSDATKRNKSQAIWNPFTLASVRETPAPGELGPGAPPFARTLQLVTDQKVHLPSLESAIISIRSVLRFQLFLEGDDEPHLAFETALVVIPADTVKDPAAMAALAAVRDAVGPATAISVTPSALTSQSSSHSLAPRSFKDSQSSAALAAAMRQEGSPPYSQPDPLATTTPAVTDGDHTAASAEQLSLSTHDLAAPPPRYSISQRSPEDSNDALITPPITPSSLHRPSIAAAQTAHPSTATRHLASVTEAADDAYEFEEDGDDDDDELAGLMSIDELAEYLPDAQFGLPRLPVPGSTAMHSGRKPHALVRKPSTPLHTQTDNSGVAVVTNLLARLDSSNSHNSHPHLAHASSAPTHPAGL